MQSVNSQSTKWESPQSAAACGDSVSAAAAAVWQKLAITGFSHHQSHYSTVNYVVVAVAVAVAVAG